MRLRATGQTLELVESERLVPGSVEIYAAAFEFDPAWDGYAKTAVFTNRGVKPLPLGMGI